MLNPVAALEAAVSEQPLDRHDLTLDHCRAVVGDDINEQVLQECIKLDQEFLRSAPASDMEQGITLLEIGSKWLLTAEAV